MDISLTNMSLNLVLLRQLKYFGWLLNTAAGANHIRKIAAGVSVDDIKLADTQSVADDMLRERVVESDR